MAQRYRYGAETLHRKTGRNGMRRNQKGCWSVDGGRQQRGGTRYGRARTAVSGVGSTPAASTRKRPFKSTAWKAFFFLRAPRCPVRAPRERCLRIRAALTYPRRVVAGWVEGWRNVESAPPSDTADEVESITAEARFELGYDRDLIVMGTTDVEGLSITSADHRLHTVGSIEPSQ